MSKHPAAELSRSLQETTLPSTEQVTSALEKTQISLEEEGKQKGYFTGERKLAKDAAQFVGTAKEFIEEKNQGEILQQMVKDTGLAVEELSSMFEKQEFFLKRDQLISMKVDAKDWSRHAQHRLEAMKTLAITLINSQEFRSILIDFFQLVQETFKQTIQEAPSLYPSSEPGKLSEEATAKATETAQFGQKLVSDIKQGTLPIPEEKKQNITNQFNVLFRKLASDPNWKSSIDGLLGIVDQIQFNFKQLKQQSGEQLSEQSKQLYYSPDSGLYKMANDLKIFVGNFTGIEILDKLKGDALSFWELTSNDQRINNWFWDLRQYTIDVLRNPEFLDKEEYKNAWSSFYDRGIEIFQDNTLNKCFYTVWYDLEYCVNSIKNDTLQQQLSVDASKLAKDLFLDTSGKPSLNIMASGMNNLKNLVVPIIKKNMEHIHVGQIGGTNETYDWSIDSLNLNAREIIPDHIEMKVWGRADISLTNQPSVAVTYLTMWIRNIHLDAKDMKFYFRRKSIPKIEDRGVADVLLRGKNELKITWRIVGEQNSMWDFSIEQVKCYLDDLDITIKESNHSFLMKMITTLFSGTIRRSVEDQVEQGVRDGLFTINDKMNDALHGIGY